MHIGEAVHAFTDVRKILSIIAHMDHNELSLGVAGQNTVARLQQFCVTRKIAAIKGPIRMRIQFLKAFIETIDGKEESLRIRNVNRYRHAQRPTCFPHGVETWIVNSYQWALRDSLTQVETERLKNFEAARPGSMSPNNFIGLKLAVTRPICTFPPRLREGYKPFRIGLLKRSNRFVQSFDHPSRQVYHHAYILAVHAWQQSLHRRQILHCLAYPDSVGRIGCNRQVGMNVNDRIT